MVDSPAAKDAYHHGDLRQALLAAALEAVDRDGADAVSLAALARALEVSQTAPYRHFPDRESLLAAVSAEGFRIFCKALCDAQKGRSRRPTLIRMCHAYLDFGRERRGLYRLMFATQLLARVPQDGELAKVAAESFGLLVAALPPAAPVQRERTARKIWVALHGTVMLAGEGLLGERPAASTLDALVEDIVGEPGSDA